MVKYDPMPRQPRIDLADHIYHVINRANGRVTILKTAEDYQHFESLLEEAKELINIRILENENGYAVFVPFLRFGHGSINYPFMCLRYSSRVIPSTRRLLSMMKDGSDVSRGIMIGRFIPFFQ